jgi:hypothetical protein
MRIWPRVLKKKKICSHTYLHRAEVIRKAACRALPLSRDSIRRMIGGSYLEALLDV